MQQAVLRRRQQRAREAVCGRGRASRRRCADEMAVLFVVPGTRREPRGAVADAQHDDGGGRWSRETRERKRRKGRREVVVQSERDEGVPLDSSAGGGGSDWSNIKAAVTKSNARSSSRGHRTASVGARWRAGVARTERKSQSELPARQRPAAACPAGQRRRAAQAYAQVRTVRDAWPDATAGSPTRRTVERPRRRAMPRRLAAARRTPGRATSARGTTGGTKRKRRRRKREGKRDKWVGKWKRRLEDGLPTLGSALEVGAADCSGLFAPLSAPLVLLIATAPKNTAPAVDVGPRREKKASPWPAPMHRGARGPQLVMRCIFCAIRSRILKTVRPLFAYPVPGAYMRTTLRRDGQEGGTWRCASPSKTWRSPSYRRRRAQR